MSAVIGHHLVRSTASLRATDVVLAGPEHTTALHDAGLSWLQADTLALIDHGYCEVAKEREHE